MRGCSLPAVSLLVGVALSAAGATTSPASAGELVPLHLEATIPLGDVKGRIDHMAIDLARQRLFVAELGNDSVGIVDLNASKVSGRIRGLKEPQGVGYVPSTDTLYVANAGDGSVRLFQGEDLEEASASCEKVAPVFRRNDALFPRREHRIDPKSGCHFWDRYSGHLELGDDADNVRVDSAGNRVIVGYGEGALAIIDAKENRTLARIALHGHPESFRLESDGRRVFVNVPDAHAIEVADRESGTVIAQWPTGRSSANFPMALDETSRRVLVVFRNPAMLTAYSMQDGVSVASARTCGDADDVFVDAKRHRVYVSCGEGHLDVFEDGGTFRRLARIPTASGARTALFVPEIDRVFLAVRASAHEPAAIWVYRPDP